METSQTDQEPTSKMEDLMGFKIKVAERAGTALKNLFRLDQNLEGGACSREDCSTFTQGGEELPDCTRRNITYERQISEAVQIRGRGKLALNSKGEYDRCKIHRLTIENQEENLTFWKEDEGGNNVAGREGEQQLLENRIRMDREGITKTGKREITRNQKRGAYVVGRKILDDVQKRGTMLWWWKTGVRRKGTRNKDWNFL